MTKRAITAILYSHKRPPSRVWERCEQAITAAIQYAEERGVTVELLPVTEWDLLDAQRFPRLQAPAMPEGTGGHHDGYNRILHGCHNAKNKRVAILEHDVLYPLNYFVAAARLPVDNSGYTVGAPFRYNQSIYRWSPDVGFWYHPNKGNKQCWVTSNLVADRDTLADELAHRIDNQPVIKWGEPGRYWSDYTGTKHPVEIWDCGEIAVDLRWGGNFTGDRKPPNGTRVYDRVEAWGSTVYLRQVMGL